MYNYKIMMLLIFMLGLTACEDFFEQVVDVEIPEHEPTIAATFNFNEPDSTHQVYVGKTLGILESGDNEGVSDATVELWKDGALFMEFDHEANGNYKGFGNFNFGNESYTLKVSAPGFEAVSAEQTPPSKVEINDATFEEGGTVDFDGERADEITINIDDPEGVENFYSVQILESRGEDIFAIYPESNDPVAENIDNGIVFTDKTFDGKNYNIVVYFFPWQLSTVREKMTVRLISWTKDKYLFEKSYYSYLNASGNPFAEPAIVHSNCSSEAGIFSISRVSEFDLEF